MSATLNGQAVPDNLPAALERIRYLERQLEAVRQELGPKRLWAGRPLQEAVRELVLEVEGRL